MAQLTILYKAPAIKALQKMPRNQSELVRRKIKQYADDQTRFQTVALKGRDGFRLRVGQWRVIMDREGNVLNILNIGPRGNIYD